jgi:hypothetical protein
MVFLAGSSALQQSGILRRHYFAVWDFLAVTIAARKSQLLIAPNFSVLQ